MNVSTWIKDNSQENCYRVYLGLYALTLTLTSEGWLAVIILNDLDNSERVTLPKGLGEKEAKQEAIKWFCCKSGVLEVDLVSPVRVGGEEVSVCVTC